MAIIMPKVPGFAEHFGTGMSQVLSGLASNKIKQMGEAQKRSQQAAGLMQIPGMDPRLANIIVNFDPKTQANALQSLPQLMSLFGQQSQQQQGGQPAGYGQSMGYGQPMGEQSMGYGQPMGEQPMGEQPMGQQPTEYEQQQGGQPTQIEQFSESLKSTETKLREKEDKRREKELGIKEGEFGLKKQEVIDKKQEAINKRFQPHIDEVFKRTRAQGEILDVMNLQDEAIKRGNLPHPVVASIFKAIDNKFGINLTGLLSKDAQLYESTENQLIKFAKPFFGTRVSNDEVMKFLKQFSNLVNSDEGKERINQGLRIIFKGSEAEKEAIMQLQDEYDYNLPKNFNRLLEKKHRKLKAKYINEFKAFSKLPDVSLFKEGDIIETNNIEFKNTGSDWETNT